jgi:hypothetical protein
MPHPPSSQASATSGLVIAEWWRGRSDAREVILRGVRVEPTTADLAQLAGEGLAAVSSAATIDALVMASAARRGDIVYTSDVDDRADLKPPVRVIGMGPRSTHR